MIEYITRVNPPVMIARGILHGCIGKCCSKEYPSVFANLGEKSIWNFIVGKSFAQTLVIDDNIVGDDTDSLDCSDLSYFDSYFGFYHSFHLV